MPRTQCSCGAVYCAADIEHLSLAGYADEDGIAAPRAQAVFALVNCTRSAHPRAQTIAIALTDEAA